MSDPVDKELLAAGLAAGSLDPEERDRVEDALAKGDPELENAIRDYDIVLEALADGIDPVPVPDAVRAELMARIEADVRDELSARRGGGGRRSGGANVEGRLWFATAALVILAFGIGGTVFLRESHELRARLAERTSELDATRLEADRLAARIDSHGELLAQREQELASSRALLHSLTAPRGRSVQLAGLGPAVEAHARAYVDPAERRVVVFVYDLPPLPEEQTYQLWVIAEGEDPVPAGTFGTDPEGRGHHEAVTIPAISGPTTIAVTIEPAPGVPQPTGPMVLAGT